MPIAANQDDAPTSSTSSPLRVAHADQAPLNADSSDLSDLFSIFSCSESDFSDLFSVDGLSGTRTIDGSSRLYSSDNPVYLLPLDDEEWQRIDKQNLLLRLGMWGLNPLQHLVEAVINSTPSGQHKTVLDIGCGSGQWALTMAAEFTDVNVVAIDQVSQLPDGPLPPNLEFRICNVNDGLEEYYGSYDIVHARCIGAGINSYRAFIEAATKCIRPGGLAIFVEGDFDLMQEDQDTVQEPVSENNPNGSHLQRWMQAVRKAQIERCGLQGSDDSPETLDKGLWQFGVYDPATCGTGSVFTPLTPWVKSSFPEENLHYKVAGILMRQNIKLFVTATEQSLLESGYEREELSGWMDRISQELEGEGAFKLWFRWRVAWGSLPGAVQNPEIRADASTTSKPQRLRHERHNMALHELLLRVNQFKIQPCRILNQKESQAYAHRRNTAPFSSRGRF